MRRTNRKNKGVSTIIAAALLVAMTVIIGMALGSTVLSAPTVQKLPQLEMSGWASVSANEIKLTHLGGDPINTGSVTFRTYIPSGLYADIYADISNEINPGDHPYGEMWWYQQEDPLHISMRLETDTWGYQWDHPDWSVPVYGYEYMSIDYSSGSGTYTAPVQAGDTLVIDFDTSFATGSYGTYMPAVGEQFIVEIYQDGTPFTAVTITVQS
jgi:flagellin-like protein